MDAWTTIGSATLFPILSPVDTPSPNARNRRSLGRWCLATLLFAFVLQAATTVLIALDPEFGQFLTGRRVPGGQISISSGPGTWAWPPGPGRKWVYSEPDHLNGIEHLLVFPTDGSGLRPRRDTPRFHWLMPALRSRPGADRIVRSGAGPPSTVILCGWPLYSATCVHHPSGVVSWGIPRDFRGAIPLRPIFPGVIVNTLAFTPPALVILLLAHAVNALALAIEARGRIKPGICIAPRCGYSVIDLDTCPECGTKQPTKHRPPTPAS